MTRARPGLAIEWLLAAAVLASLAWIAVSLHRDGYVPMPLFPDPTDTYGDGYNTTWWAHNGDMYSTWASVYPPLAFVIAKLFSNARCYDADAAFVRDCDWTFWWAMLGCWALNGWLAFATYRRVDRTTAWPRALALTLGLPMLFLFDRLNLLIVAYAGMFAAYGYGIRSARWRWLALAVAINLKPYFLAVLAAQLLHKRWRWAEGALIATVAVAALSYLAVGSGSPAEIYRNIADFSSDPNRAASWPFIFYASSYDSLIQFLESSFPLMAIVGSGPLDLWPGILRTVIHLTQAATIAACVGIWWRPGMVSRIRAMTLCYTFVIITVEPGGYTMAGAIFGVFFEAWRGPARIAIVCAYLLSISFDVNWAYLGSFWADSYRTHGPVFFESWVTLGPFVRPGIVIAMQLALCAATFADLRRKGAFSIPSVPTPPFVPSEVEGRASGGPFAARTSTSLGTNG